MNGQMINEIHTHMPNKLCYMDVKTIFVDLNTSHSPLISCLLIVGQKSSTINVGGLQVKAFPEGPQLIMGTSRVSGRMHGTLGAHFPL